MGNVLKNGDFSTASDWSLSSRATICSNGGLLGGCLQYANNSIGGAIDAWQKVQLASNKKYTVTWFAKKQGRFDIWGAHAYYSNTGEWKFFNGPALEGRLINDTYVQISYTFTLPPSSELQDNYVWIYIRAGANPSDGNTFILVDNVYLEDAGGGPSGPIPFALKAFGGRCTGNSVSVRIGPDISFSQYAMFDLDDRADVFTFTGLNVSTQAMQSWLALQWSAAGEFVYVYARYMGMDPNSNAALNIGPRAKVTATDTYLRDYPSATSFIRSLGNGVKMIVLDASSVPGWWRVVTINGTGWVSSTNVAYD